MPVKKAIAALAILVLASTSVFAGTHGDVAASTITSVAGYQASVLVPETQLAATFVPSTFDASAYNAAVNIPTGQRHSLDTTAEVGSTYTERPQRSSGRYRDFFARVAITPYSMGWYDFYRGHDIIGESATTGTDYGFSASAEVGARGSASFSFFIGACYTQLWLSEYYIPDGQLMSHMQAYTGFDLRLFQIDRIDFSAGLFAGAMLSINAGEGSWASLAGARIHLEWNITDYLSLGLQTSFTASYHPNVDPLYRSMSYTLDTAALTCAVRF